MIHMISKHSIHLEIFAESGSRGNATGFLYQDRDDRRWLITARHNLYPSPDDIDSFPPTKEYHETLIDASSKTQRLSYKMGVNTTRTSALW